MLTGTFGHSGGTTIHVGTLAVGAGGAGGTLSGDVLNSGTLEFNRSDDFTYAGSVSGSGSIRKTA